MLVDVAIGLVLPRVARRYSDDEKAPAPVTAHADHLRARWNGGQLRLLPVEAALDDRHHVVEGQLASGVVLCVDANEAVAHRAPSWPPSLVFLLITGLPSSVAGWAAGSASLPRRRWRPYGTYVVEPRYAC